jgi:hypothetical protein
MNKKWGYCNYAGRVRGNSRGKLDTNILPPTTSELHLFSIALISARQRYGSFVRSHGNDDDDDAHGKQSSEHPRGKPSYPMPTILPSESTTHAPPPPTPPAEEGSLERLALRSATARK